jgi:aldehyde:ferredoxin oxidoreductase
MVIDYEKLLTIGTRIVTIERALNTRFGVRRNDDCLPPRFAEPLPSGPGKGQTFPTSQLNKMLDEYYAKRGWDRKTGLIRKSALMELKMENVAEDLERRGLTR